MKKLTQDKIIEKLVPSLVKCKYCGRWWDRKTPQIIVKQQGCRKCVSLIKRLNKINYHQLNSGWSIQYEYIEEELVNSLCKNFSKCIDNEIMASVKTSNHHEQIS